MQVDAVRTILEQLEAAAPELDLRPPLALIAGEALLLDESELNGARRRALLLLAAGGDPREGLALDGRAVVALAGELETPARRAVLADQLAALRRRGTDFPRVEAALAALAGDAETAWRCFACALLAEQL